VAIAGVSFLLGAFLSLATSWVLVTRLERVGERIGISEGLLGMVAALAADAPEITASVSALAQHQFGIGVGVVVGSNVFNVAALLGLGSVVAGRIHLHRRVVVLAGVVALWVAVTTLMTSLGVLSAPPALVLVSVALAGYVMLLALPAERRRRLPFPRAWTAWLSLAIDEEELELRESIRPPRGRAVDVVVAIGALVVVVGSSVAMEHGAARLGRHFHVADAVIGGVVLAAVTSLPNAVAGVYLATKGRDSAALSTALNSNNLNVLAGLLIPGAILGIATRSSVGTLTSASYLVLTALVVGVAYVCRGVGRRAGWLIILLYALFVVLVIALA
jgi:cation:H+ antiporter